MPTLSLFITRGAPLRKVSTLFVDRLTTLHCICVERARKRGAKEVYLTPPGTQDWQEWSFDRAAGPLGNALGETVGLSRRPRNWAHHTPT